jgi:L-erythro-3,5-diaminohexanoate dehydrogenase
MKKGCKYGTHRSLQPVGILPQPALKVSNDMGEIYDNEILIDVAALNIDSASFTQIKNEAAGDKEKIAARITAIVNEYGKMKNPVTGSGGVLIGTVEKIGSAIAGTTDLKVGDRLVTLVSLSLTPLRIDKIHSIDSDIDRVNVSGKAILFESGLYAKIPADLPENVSMAAMDVCGAPAQVAKLVRPGQSVLIFGAGGKSGILCCYEAKKRVGPTGRVIGIEKSPVNIERLKKLGFCNEVLDLNAKDPVTVLNAALAANNGKEYDISINCLNIPDCEMSCVLPVRDEGTVYFFSMATSFTQAALGAEGVGKDVTMIIGNGYTKGHAEITFQVLRNVLHCANCLKKYTADRKKISTERK